ncbi:hypothetical protein ACPA9J_27625 [Pseudomonas aeruginosa]
MAGTTAAAWAPAAAFASIATLGGAAIPACRPRSPAPRPLASSLAVIPGLATGGMVNGAGTGTSDSNLRWLSNGEFVVNAEATRRESIAARGYQLQRPDPERQRCVKLVQWCHRFGRSSAGGQHLQCAARHPGKRQDGERPVGARRRVREHGRRWTGTSGHGR